MNSYASVILTLGPFSTNFVYFQQVATIYTSLNHTVGRKVSLHFITLASEGGRALVI